MNFGKQKRLLLFCCTLFTLTTFATLTFAQFSSPGGGVDDSNGAFQLEGNATTDSGICFRTVANGGPSIATPGPGNSCPPNFTFVAFGAQTDDWANVNTGGSSFHGLATTGIVADLTNSAADNIFTGGGSKDIYDISSWLWKNGKPQGKDDIAHAFAAAYNLPSGPHAGHTVVYFGLDRFDNSGDSTAGFWFMQDSTIGLNGAKGGGGTHFTGSHKDGDVLVVSDFSTGGAISSITVYQWKASLGTIQQVTSLPGAELGECDPTTGQLDVCAIVNPVDGLASPWGFLDKSGNTTFAHGEFLEGAVDLTAIFGANVPCVTVFMAETRSSNTPSATLSDFSPPTSLPLCGMTINKACNGNGTVSADGTSVAYSWTVTVTNTGVGSLYDVTVHDTKPDGSTQDTQINGDNNPLAPHASNTLQVSFTATSGNVANPLSVTNSATAFAYTQPMEGGVEIFPSNGSSMDTCTASVTNGLSVTKHCDATNGGPILVQQGSNVVVEVPFTAVICNTGTEAVNGITLSDSPSATINNSPTSLDAGVCTPAAGQPGAVTGSYFPSNFDSTSSGTSPGRYTFTDTLTANGTGVLDKKAVSGANGVTCPICPDSECSGKPLP